MRHIDTFASEHPELVKLAQSAGKKFYTVDSQDNVLA
jgi:hypothetical protein